MLFQLTQGVGEPPVNIHAEFITEVVLADLPKFHLKDEFPDHAFLVGRRQGTVNRKPTLSDSADVRSEFVFILEMRASNVGK